jgi:hypothetical protein
MEMQTKTLYVDCKNTPIKIHELKHEQTNYCLALKHNRLYNLYTHTINYHRTTCYFTQLHCVGELWIGFNVYFHETTYFTYSFLERTTIVRGRPNSTNKTTYILQ